MTRNLSLKEAMLALEGGVIVNLKITNYTVKLIIKSRSNQKVLTSAHLTLVGVYEIHAFLEYVKKMYLQGI